MPDTPTKKPLPTGKKKPPVQSGKKKPTSPAAKASKKPSGEAASKKAVKSAPRPPILVGIGASAGGLEATSNLIAALPTNLGFAYTIIQHLSPTHRSMIAQLLGRETAMAVHEITHGTEPEANVIYVTPPGKNVVFKEGRFVLQEEPKQAMPRPSVNAFFSSLAAEKSEDAIGIVLSGTGTDGAAGIREIKAVGGFTFAQEPSSAKYNGMPQAAIDTGCVDWVLPPEEIARELTQIALSPGVSQTSQQPQATSTTLKKLLMRVKQQTRIDFSGYKEGTVWRRIERRMAAKHVVTIEDYFELVERDPEELDRLCKDILISVTAFFRDPESFSSLRKTIQAILAGKRPGDEIRIWVPGCATGEEAYSIAILVADLLGPNLSLYQVQIFATDLDLNALGVARRGSYPEAAMSELDATLVARHFVKIGNRYEVSRALRDLVVIARQDLVQDPPFLRLDLVSCRNVLIYLQNELQSKVLATFHYGLRPGAYLFLGKSEGIFHQESLFEVSDKAAKIYRRRPGESRLVPGASFRLPNVREPGNDGPPVRHDAHQRMIDSAVGHFVPPSILLNATFDIQHIHGDVSPYLVIASGKPTINLQQLIRREFRADLQLLLHQVESRLASSHGRPRKIKTVDGSRLVRMSVHPMEAGVSSSFFLVSFESEPEKPIAKGQPRTEQTDDSRDYKALEEELVSTRERLQTVIEELETSNEEMQALNEEVQAANEELQSSNEELEAANEELQSTNEELTTVNEELQVRSGELAEALNDLEKIQNSVGFPILVCNSELEVTRFNSPAAAIFSLSEKSIGLPLPHMRLPPGMQDFSLRVREAILVNRIVEEQVFTNERHYLLHVSPYETIQPGLRGAILSLIDHTERMAQDKLVNESRERLLAIMNNSTSAIVLKDLAGRYEFVNRQFERIYGLEAKEVLGKTDKQLFASKVAEANRNKELEVIKHLQPQETDDLLVRFDGDRHLLSIRFPLLNTEGLIQGICTQSTDVTDRKLAEEKLRLAARVFDRAGEGIIVTDAESRILTVNDAFTKVTGYSAAEVTGKTPALLKSGRQGEEFYRGLWLTIREKGWWQGEIWNRRKSGEVYPEWLNINTVHDSEGRITNYVGIFSDISIVKESQRRMEFLATHDELTALPNRALFLDRVRQSIARSQRHESLFAVMFIDLDNFKVVNDSLGHHAGDDLLQKVATILRDCVRASDTVARFGGDEFALLIEDTSPAEADSLARRITEAFSQSIDVSGHAVYSGCSIGISLFPSDGEDADILLKHADAAMYQAKEAGKRTHYFFTAEIKDGADEKLLLSNGLRKAIENDELFLVYQPQFDLANQQVIGMEALLRWQHPERGLIMPGKFIPLAERTGLIHHLGEWVADAACHQLASWIAQGYQVPKMSINISADQFRRANLASSLQRLLAHYHLDASRLTIEITESALMADQAQCQRVLRDLKALGLTISIDDFGTGYSSLSYLRRYPIDELKIDRSFIDEIDNDPDDRAITQTVLAMANTLGLAVVAEGVETEQQLNALRDLGCGAAQGYLFSKPISASEFIERHLQAEPKKTANKGGPRRRAKV
jgi:two-component system CheB/CheR fusion protein